MSVKSMVCGAFCYPIADTILDADGVSVFYTNTDSEEIEVANYSIVKIEDAISAVKEFFDTKKLPKCIEWQEL